MNEKMRFVGLTVQIQSVRNIWYKLRLTLENIDFLSAIKAPCNIPQISVMLSKKKRAYRLHES